VKGFAVNNTVLIRYHSRRHHIGFFLARWLLLDKFDNVPKLRDFQGHIAVLLAEQDEVIPNRRTIALFDVLSERKKLWRF